jgi:hypothetical protein
MKKIIKSLLLACFAVFLPAFTFAANVEVDYGTAPGPLFAETNIAPGHTASKIVKVTNNSSTNQQFKFQATAVKTGTLSEMINLKVVNIGTGDTKYKNNFKNLYNGEEINLDVLAPSTPTDYMFTVHFDESADNNWQNQTETFDLKIGFAATPTANPATTSGTSNPAGPLAALAGALGFTPTTVTTTDNPTVAGVETQTDKEVKGSEDLFADSPNDMTCPWWWTVALVLAVVLLVVGWIIKIVNKQSFIRKYYLIWPGLFATIAWLTHYFLHKGYQATWYCDNFWLIVIIEAVFAYVLYLLLLKKELR